MFVERAPVHTLRVRFPIVFRFEDAVKRHDLARTIKLKVHDPLHVECGPRCFHSDCECKLVFCAIYRFRGYCEYYAQLPQTHTITPEALIRLYEAKMDDIADAFLDRCDSIRLLGYACRTNNRLLLMKLDASGAFKNKGIKRLLEQGFRLACKEDNADIAHFLIEKGFNSWNTGLSDAVWDLSPRIARLMIEKGATGALLFAKQMPTILLDLLAFEKRSGKSFSVSVERYKQTLHVLVNEPRYKK